jgi:hypothetical protein
MGRLLCPRLHEINAVRADAIVAKDRFHPTLQGSQLMTQGKDSRLAFPGETALMRTILIRMPISGSVDARHGL